MPVLRYGWIERRLGLYEFLEVGAGWLSVAHLQLRPLISIVRGHEKAVPPSFNQGRSKVAVPCLSIHCTLKHSSLVTLFDRHTL